MSEAGVGKMIAEYKSRRNEVSFMLYASIAKASHCNALHAVIFSSDKVKSWKTVYVHFYVLTL